MEKAKLLPTSLQVCLYIKNTYKPHKYSHFSKTELSSLLLAYYLIMSPELPSQK